jgi:hypothetical protein
MMTSLVIASLAMQDTLGCGTHCHGDREGVAMRLICRGRPRAEWSLTLHHRFPPTPKLLRQSSRKPSGEPQRSTAIIWKFWWGRWRVRLAIARRR